MHYTKMVEVADMNGDGRPDIVGGSHGDAEVFYIDGKSQAKIVIGQSIQRPMIGTVEDLDKDGDPDVVIAAGGGSMPSDLCDTGLFWLENKGKTWDRHLIHAGIASGYNAKTADLDSDGDLDIVAAYYQNPSMLIWYENKNLKWKGHALRTSFEIEGANDIVTADMNGDGKLDIVSAWSERKSRVIVYTAH